MQTMKLSSIFKAGLETLLLVFFNIIRDGNDFLVEGQVKKSKHATIGLNDDLVKEISEKLTDYYKIPFQAKGRKYICKVEDDLKFSTDQVISKLRSLIMVKIADIIDIGILDREMALALFVLRGSVDFTRNYMAVDVKRNVENELYIDSLFKILVSSNELIKYLNLNFRELQPEFKSKKRNTQLRLNLRWVYENILNEIGSIHPYKYDIISSNKFKIGDLPQTDTMYITFIQRLIYYQRNVLKKELSNIEVENIRHELFSVSKNDQKIQRSKKILLVVKDTTKDICSACSQKYKIADRSFIASREKRYYFEYHHVISFANNRELLDVPDNLVKLCPACHCAMKKGRAEGNYQKKLIKNILNNRKDVLDFSKSYLNTQSLKDTVDGIQKKLR